MKNYEACRIWFTKFDLSCSVTTHCIYLEPKRTLKGDFISFLTGKRVSYILCCGTHTPFASPGSPTQKSGILKFTIGTWSGFNVGILYKELFAYNHVQYIVYKIYIYNIHIYIHVYICTYTYMIISVYLCVCAYIVYCIYTYILYIHLRTEAGRYVRYVLAHMHFWMYI